MFVNLRTKRTNNKVRFVWDAHAKRERHAGAAGLRLSERDEFI